MPIKVTPEFDRCLFISLKKNEKCWEITGKSKQVKDGIMAVEETMNFTADLYEMDASQCQNLEIKKMKEIAVKTADMESIYRFARNLELVHGDFMKTEGNVYSVENALLFELNLTQTGAANMEKYVYHPAFIDSSFFAGAGLLQYKDEDEGKNIFIPMCIKEFIPVRRITTNKLYVYTKREDFSYYEQQGVFKSDLSLFNENGELVAVIHEYTAKMVHGNLKDAEILPDAGRNRVTVKEQNTDKVDVESLEQVMDVFKEAIAKCLEKDKGDLDLDAEFFVLGMNSKDLLEMVNTIEVKFNLELYPTIFIENPTINKASKYIYEVSLGLN